MEINQKKIIYDGKEYALQDVKVNVTLKNKAKGKTRLVGLLLLYTVISVAVLTFPIFNVIYDYMFFVYAPLMVIFMWGLFFLLSKYFWEYAVIEFGKDRKLRLLYSHERKMLVDKIMEIAGSVSYIHA
ncbi:MAG: hypothetical protein B2I17_07595 [Thermoplasmatales archaeon B_DKE]|nr:MAG: hypothetical protein B2I17_07595 [Thermoplasmatales archaeon B_DKE]